ncbi:MAG: hypothetical protein P8Y80_12150 [Acidobacteriota bacterium]|jgi:hypothetical protein
MPNEALSQYTYTKIIEQSGEGVTLRSIRLFLMIIFIGSTPIYGEEEKLLEVSVCDLQKDPDAYNHRLIQVQGRISHEFEDFTLHDDRCADNNEPWLMYGGDGPNDITYCCGLNTGSKEKVNIEGFDVPFKRDSIAERFINILNSYRINKKAKIVYLETDPSFSVTATIIGRFFAGNKTGIPGRGYGHMGCCSLLVIQQILSIDKIVTNIKPGERSCYTEGWNEIGGDIDELASMLNARHKNDEPWRKKDARRVATEALNLYLRKLEPALEFKGCKSEHLTYSEKLYNQYMTTCRWNSNSSDFYVVEVMKFYFLKNSSNNWKDISWMPSRITHEHCSDRLEPE